MEPNNRMGEITGNLKKDVKDLLSESANIVTGFFKRGLCTVRAVADKWKAFAQSVSSAADELNKHHYIYRTRRGGSRRPAPSWGRGARPPRLPISTLPPSLLLLLWKVGIGISPWASR